MISGRGDAGAGNRGRIRPPRRIISVSPRLHHFLAAGLVLLFLAHISLCPALYTTAMYKIFLESHCFVDCLGRPYQLAPYREMNQDDDDDYFSERMQKAKKLLQRFNLQCLRFSSYFDQSMLPRWILKLALLVDQSIINNTLRELDQHLTDVTLCWKRCRFEGGEIRGILEKFKGRLTHFNYHKMIGMNIFYGTGQEELEWLAQTPDRSRYMDLDDFLRTAEYTELEILDLTWDMKEIIELLTISSGGQPWPKSLAHSGRTLLTNVAYAQAKDATDMDEAWHMLEEALHDIHSKTSGRLSFEELYRAAYKMVIKKKGAVLYERVKKFEEQWFATHVIPKIDKMVRKMLYNHNMESSWTSANERRRRGETFLTGLRDIWHDHNTSMNMMADILMYLDRGYSQQQPNQLPIFATTIALFRDHILRCNINNGSDTLVIDLLIRIMLEQIDMEREGDVIDRNLIRDCSQMLTCLYEDRDERADKTLYLTIFQPRFLANSRNFYERECQRLLQEADVSSWLRHTQRRLVEEANRCGTTIERETLPHTQAVIEQTLISLHLQEFLAMETSGVKWMIDNDKTEDLSMLYGLITRVDQNKTALQTILHRCIIELGIEIEKVLEKADASAAATAQVDKAASEGDRAKTLTPVAQQTAVAIKWVDDVLRLKEKFDGLLSQCFHGDLTMQTALTKSFSDFINLFRRSSEYVSLYIDDSLKRGIRGKTESEVDAVLDKVIVLMCYLQDRDLLQTYYQRHLARRLLHGKSESQDVEKAIISRIKQELGHQFTSKFEGMFRDLVTSSELTSTYHTHMTAVGDGSAVIELSVNVLTTNFWPPETMGRQSSIGDGSRIACVLPREIQRLQASFEQFYLVNRNGRRLTWIASTGSADVQCTFPAIPGKTGTLARERRYELHVPTFSMTVLMLFNDIEDGTSLSFEEIQVKTGIATADLMRALTAIAVAPKSRVLLKEPATKSVKPGDVFAFNAAFQSKAVRIKAPIINGVSKIEDRQERRRTEEKNDQTRAHIIDAAVVRIMKSRKTLSHGKLVSEVIEQLSSRFKPDVLLIKRRIEDLIVREYLERPEDEEAPSTYRYVA